jgi:hypothetical protein
MQKFIFFLLTHAMIENEIVNIIYIYIYIYIIILIFNFFHFQRVVSSLI